VGLIQCPDCSGQLSTEATACPHCGRPTGKSSRTGRYLTVVAILGALLVFAVFVRPDPRPTVPQASQPRSAPAAPAPAEPHVSIGAWTWRHENGYAIAEGQITSASSYVLEDVEAVVTFTTQDGEVITSQGAPIASNPLFPGQKSAWRVVATWDPAIASASLQFQTAFGFALGAESER